MNFVCVCGNRSFSYIDHYEPIGCFLYVFACFNQLYLFHFWPVEALLYFLLKSFSIESISI